MTRYGLKDDILKVLREASASMLADDIAVKLRLLGRPRLTATDIGPALRALRKAKMAKYRKLPAGSMVLNGRKVTIYKSFWSIGSADRIPPTQERLL